MGCLPLKWQRPRRVGFPVRALGSYSFSEYILLAGGVYPAFLARSLAALRRSSLNGSLTLTQLFGTA